MRGVGGYRSEEHHISLKISPWGDEIYWLHIFKSFEYSRPCSCKHARAQHCHASACAITANVACLYLLVPPLSLCYLSNGFLFACTQGSGLASFPGLPTIQFMITYNTSKRSKTGHCAEHLAHTGFHNDIHILY